MNLYFRLLLLSLRARRRAAIGLWDEAVTPFRVTLTDLDPLRHMTNSKYLALLDLGRVDLMMRTGFWSKLSREGWYPVVASQTITFRRSLKLGQRFELHTRILGFDERSAYTEQTFRVGETVYARAVVRARFLKKSGGAVARDELERLAGGFPDSLKVPDWVGAWAAASRVTETTAE